MAKKDVPPRWDRRMQQRLAHGEAAAGQLGDAEAIRDVLSAAAALSRM